MADIEHTDTPPPALGDRIVSLVPSVTESLFDLGLGSKIVGVTEYCIYPAEGVAGITQVGGTKNPNVPAIIDLEPTIVIVNTEENRREDVDALEAADVSVWITDVRTVRTALDVLWEITRRGSVPQQAPRLISLETIIDWQNQAIEWQQPLRVFAPIWRNPAHGPTVKWWMTINHDTYVHDLLWLCGAENVFADQGERYPKVTPDALIAAQPDVILLPSEPFAFGQADLELLAALPELTDRIFLVDGSLLTWHGTRLGLALQTLPALLSDMPAF